MYKQQRELLLLTGYCEFDLLCYWFPYFVVSCAEINSRVSSVQSNNLQRLVQQYSVSWLFPINLENKQFIVDAC